MSCVLHWITSERRNKRNYVGPRIEPHIRNVINAKKKLLKEKPEWEGKLGDLSTNGKVLLKRIMER